jgi:hypothetical protein
VDNDDILLGGLLPRREARLAFGAAGAALILSMSS